MTKPKILSPEANSQKRVGIHYPSWTSDTHYQVRWGSVLSYNYPSHMRRFKTLKAAKVFAKRIGKGGKYMLVSYWSEEVEKRR